MATPLIVRGHAKERSLEDMCADHQCYVSSGSVKKDAQMFFNCISEPIFDIPVSQVNESNITIIRVTPYRSAHLVSTSCWGSSLIKMFHLLEALCCQLDWELTSQTTDFDSSSFSKYSQGLQRLPFLQADLETAQHAQEVSQQVCGLSPRREKSSCCGSFEAICCKKEISEGTCKSLSNMHNCI